MLEVGTGDFRFSLRVYSVIQTLEFGVDLYPLALILHGGGVLYFPFCFADPTSMYNRDLDDRASSRLENNESINI